MIVSKIYANEDILLIRSKCYGQNCLFVYYHRVKKKIIIKKKWMEGTNITGSQGKYSTTDFRTRMI